jgi:hypothetical protein
MEIYRGLLYARLREAHDRIYFGAWRGSSPTLGDLVEARRQLESFFGALEQELQQASPPGAREYLAKARETCRQVEPESAPGPAVLLAINSADDERNPPETGIMERELKRVQNAKLYLIRASEDTRGHGTTAMAKFYKQQLQELLQSAPRRAM